ncbi:MAG TPA: hypothetical protein G4O05_02885 [Caldilineae bacterium]|nr:hypothetical protein [Caldilineae bacterium]HIQ12361.1 hypothetical protein [Caldilineales bacterium]
MLTAKTLSLLAFSAALFAAPILADAELPGGVQNPLHRQQPVTQTVLPAQETQEKALQRAEEALQKAEASPLSEIQSPPSEDLPQQPAVDIPPSLKRPSSRRPRCRSRVTWASPISLRCLRRPNMPGPPTVTFMPPAP